jgi:hypothetical protein
MLYRVALQKFPSGLWRWESPVIASVEGLLRLLGMYRSIPRSQLRVFFASSVEGLDLLLDREAKGLASSSISVEQLLPGRWRTSHSLNQLELRQFESALGTCESTGWEQFPPEENLRCMRRGVVLHQKDGRAGQETPRGRTWGWW